MHGKDKLSELKQSIQARKEAEVRRSQSAGSDISPGREAQYQKKIQELESTLERALSQAEEMKAKADEHHDQFVRKHAELENVRKRLEKEKSDVAKYGHEKVLGELLPVLDSLDKALEHADESHDFQDLLAGVELVLKQLLQALGKFGLGVIEAKGKPFDPNIHEAVGHHESEAHPPDHVMEEHRRGYRLHDRVLRPSMVSVSKGPKEK
jgi:molecular chaperone GrpE